MEQKKGEESEVKERMESDREEGGGLRNGVDYKWEERLYQFPLAISNYGSRISIGSRIVQREKYRVILGVQCGSFKRKQIMEGASLERGKPTENEPLLNALHPLVH